jgi:hypothetical protein
MAEYKGIKGFKVQTVSTDPAASAIAGGTWASGGNLNSSRSNAGGAGIQTSALMVGLDNASPNPGNVEEYNGSAWSEQTDLTTGRNAKAFGANAEAVLAVGGYDPAIATGSTKTEIWNGSGWTEVNDLNVKREAMGVFGIYTAGLIATGFERGSTPARPANVESWNGTSWTEVNNVNTARSGITGSGLQTSGIISGGSPVPAGNLVESWDGTSWTTTTSMNTSRDSDGSGSGTSNSDALVFGGATPAPVITANTEFWNGTTWTELNNLSIARFDSMGGGNSSPTASITFGGLTPSELTATEEWTAPSVFQQENLGQVFYNSTSNVFKVTQQSAPAGTWSSGGDLNTARYRFGGASQGTQNAGLVFGSDSPTYGQTEEYNGTAWSEQNDLNTGRYISYGGAGTQTACVTAGGYNPAGSPVFNTVVSETYNGTSWTEGNDLNTGRLDCSTFGSSTAGVLVGGGTGSGGPNTVTNVEIYDGTSWSETTDIPTATQEMGSLGTGTAGLIFGGSVDNDPTTKNTTIEWDGTSWTSGGNYPIYIKYTTGFGSLTNGIGAGGSDQTGAISGVCNVYNGTSWSEIAELTTARLGLSGNGTGVAGFVAGGYTTVAVTTTEEWNVPATNSTLTVS